MKTTISRSEPLILVAALSSSSGAPTFLHTNVRVNGAARDVLERRKQLSACGGFKAATQGAAEMGAVSLRDSLRSCGTQAR
mmetsp:Transcript_17224/g.34452  ORF Transcript_17224/g.34452 Transcript_17224/m.34452 type:complete len:81 (+) Transcript_17224:432-674(+)